MEGWKVGRLEGNRFAQDSSSFLPTSCSLDLRASTIDEHAGHIARDAITTIHLIEPQGTFKLGKKKQ